MLSVLTTATVFFKGLRGSLAAAPANYYLAATAYNSTGCESSLSGEVSS
jgi:hypothetical protein